jgi:hypothetical protein
VERHLPFEKKTIKPLTQSMGGIAGGDKYVARGILFVRIRYFCVNNYRNLP